MAESLNEVGDKLAGIGRFLSPAGLRNVTKDVAMDSKKQDFEPEIQRDIGADRKMSNWGRFKFNVRYDLVSNSVAEITPSPKGPWQVLNFGRRGRHKLPKRKRDVYKRYNIPGVGVRTATRANPWKGSSSQGKGTFSKAARTTIRKTPERVQKHIRNELLRRF